MTARATPAVAAVDWGTSHLRIWLLDAAGAVLAERRTEQGMLATARDRFAEVLEGNLALLDAPATLPVMICGMAGARQGWIEAPYLPVPVAPTDVAAGAVPVPGGKRDIRIIPGLAQKNPEAPDVMRGEETQLAGIAERLEAGRHLVCMPGTHSKWVEVRDGRVMEFGTWLTGELFSVLAKHSILRHAVGGAASVSPDSPAFRRALEEACAAPEAMTARLFAIRASTLLLDRSPDEALAALSGLLIGTEIGSATRRFALTDELVLIASGALGALYTEALRATGRSPTVIDADLAVRSGLMEAARHHSTIGQKVRA